MEIEHLIRYAPLAVKLMEIEKIRYAPFAVGLKPSAMECEARLRGLYRIISSKTISPRLCKAKSVDCEIVQNPVEALQTGNIDPLFIGVQSSAHRSETDRGNAGAAVEPGV
jgi:hypothetical protein